MAVTDTRRDDGERRATTSCKTCGVIGELPMRRIIETDEKRGDYCPSCFAAALVRIVTTGDEPWFWHVLDVDGPEECYEIH